jgi:hypothetical protein
VATGDVGTLGVDLTIDLSGVEATGGVGTVLVVSPYEVDAFAAFSFAEGPFGGASYTLPITLELSGVDATGDVGSVGVEVSPELTGVWADCDVGTVLVPSSYDLDAFATFAFAEGPFGGSYYALPTIDVLTGVVGNTDIGSVSVEISVDLFGVEALGEAGSVATISTTFEVDTFAGFSFAEGPFGGSLYTLPILFELVGVQATGEVGAVTASSSSIGLSGVSSAGQVGDLQPTYASDIIGNAAVGAVGSVGVRYWSTIVDAQTPGWVDINNGAISTPVDTFSGAALAEDSFADSLPTPQQPGWANITSAQGSIWTSINTGAIATPVNTFSGSTFTEDSFAESLPTPQTPNWTNVDTTEDAEWEEIDTVT